MKNKKRNTLITSGFIVLLLFLFILDLMTGSVEIKFVDLWRFFTFRANENEAWFNGFRLFRLSRVITALLAGAALSVSGLLMQALFRNPLAGPYILGISSGASLGVALAVMGTSVLGFGMIQNEMSDFVIVMSAAIGAFLLMLLIALIALRQQDIMTLLVLGVLIGSAVSALVGLLQFFSQSGKLKLFVLWTMGSLRNVSVHELQYLVPVVFIGLFLAWIIASNLNLLLLGENSAQTLGLKIKTTRMIIFISVSLLAGSVTAFCGPIGFIGIAVPHLVRTIFRTYDHRLLFPLSVILGAAAMLLADILSNLGGSVVLPINSITALLGIPFILWLIVSKRKSFFQ